MTKRPSVLLVDDEPAVHATLKLLLGRFGFETVSVHDGAEALERFNEEEFKFVITDFSMPEMNGVEVAEALKARSPRIPIVLLTAFVERFRSETPSPAIDMILPKPISIQELQRAVEAVTAGPAMKGKS